MPDRTTSDGADPFRLELYILSDSPRSSLAIENLRSLCEEWLGGRYALEIIDVLEQPDRAERERILATPTLIKRAPLPVHRIIGDMSATERVLIGLGLKPQRTWSKTLKTP